MSYWQWSSAMAGTRTKKFGASVVLVAIVAAIGAGLVESIKDTAKSLASGTLTWGRNWIEDTFPPQFPQADKNAAISILVAHLEGDLDGSQTSHLSDSLSRALDLSDKGRQVQVLTARRTLKRGTSGDLWRQREAAESMGREWLKQSGADLLVWGEVARKDKVLRINFLSSQSEMAKRPKENYALSDRLELSPDFQ
jgi:hypothetical protein